MPFKSKAQARFMHAKHPKIAKEFAAKTPSIKALPEMVKPEKKPRKARKSRGNSRTDALKKFNQMSGGCQ